MKQCYDVEPMVWQFHSTNVTCISQSGDPQTRGFETGYVFRIHSVIAEMTRLDDFYSVDGAQPRTW